jgi:hypothetical protein
MSAAQSSRGAPIRAPICGRGERGPHSVQTTPKVNWGRQGVHGRGGPKLNWGGLVDNRGILLTGAPSCEGGVCSAPTCIVHVQGRVWGACAGDRLTCTCVPAQLGRV